MLKENQNKIQNNSLSEFISFCQGIVDCSKGFTPDSNNDNYIAGYSLLFDLEQTPNINNTYTLLIDNNTNSDSNNFYQNLPEVQMQFDFE